MNFLYFYNDASGIKLDCYSKPSDFPPRFRGIVYGNLDDQKSYQKK
jgi:hypothetical protein